MKNKIIKTSLITITSLLVLTWTLTSFAQEPITYEISLSHDSNEPAHLHVNAVENIKNLKISISNCGTPKTINFSVKEMNYGETQQFTWKQKPGKHNCTLNFSTNTPEGAWKANTSLEILSLEPLDLVLNLRELSAKTNNIKFTSNRPAKQIEIQVLSKDATTIDNFTKNFDSPSLHQTVSWKESDLPPALVNIKITDEYGAWVSKQLFYYQIPHTDIVFDTAKYNIRSDQTHFLQESKDKILEVIKKHDTVAMDLYIAGYTDTVGSNEDNLKLSLKRAQSIAAWFKSNGINIPVYYQGYGEKILAVMTPDNTDEEKNRRAVYILTNSPPISDAFPQNRPWIKL